MNEVYCEKCGKMHTKDGEFYKNDENDTVLCKACFEKYVLKRSKK